MSKRHRKNRTPYSVVTESGRPVRVTDSYNVLQKHKEMVTYDAMVGLDGSVKKLVDVKTGDSFSNPIARLGYGTENLLNATEYPLTRLTQNYALMNSLYRDNWVVGNIVSTIPEDMCKNWYEIKTDEKKDLIDRFKRMERKTHLKQKVIEGLKWGRLYGGAAALILIKNQMNELDKPLNLDTINVDDFQGLYVMDRWSGITPDAERIMELGDIDYGLPKYYKVNDSMGRTVARVHHSRVLRFIGRALPLYEKIAEQDWGESEVEMAYSEVVKRDNVANNIASLTFKANISVYEMDNVEQLFAIAGSQAQKRFWDMMQAQSVLESNLGVKIVNKGDNVRNLSYSFGGLRDVYEGIMMDLAGATHIPVTKLFGRSPAGMNATGQSDLQNYYDYIEDLRESQLRPVIEKLLPILAMSVFGRVPKDLDFEFNPVQNPTDQEKTQAATQKVSAIAQAFQSNIITQKIAMKEFAELNKRYGLFASIGDEEIAKAKDKVMMDMQNMEDPMAGLTMGGDYESDWDKEEEPKGPRTVEEINADMQKLMAEANELMMNEREQQEREKLQASIEKLQNDKIETLSKIAANQALVEAK